MSGLDRSNGSSTGPVLLWLSIDFRREDDHLLALVSKHFLHRDNVLQHCLESADVQLQFEFVHTSVQRRVLLDGYSFHFLGYLGGRESRRDALTVVLVLLVSQLLSRLGLHTGFLYHRGHMLELAGCS